MEKDMLSVTELATRIATISEENAEHSKTIEDLQNKMTAVEKMVRENNIESHEAMVSILSSSSNYSREHEYQKFILEQIVRSNKGEKDGFIECLKTIITDDVLGSQKSTYDFMFMGSTEKEDLPMITSLLNTLLPDSFGIKNIKATFSGPRIIFKKMVDKKE